MLLSAPVARGLHRFLVSGLRVRLCHGPTEAILEHISSPLTEATLTHAPQKQVRLRGRIVFDVTPCTVWNSIVPRRVFISRPLW